ncbi:MAG: hypothetical protein RMY28_036250 [Nostoc sp. ChiSLP01]|nr:hypothetical protein [Nostoc sp. CmiSLP01]MDZ8286332.1 hypothetical protein [Nostoc sp. ChiSLP01]
MKSTKRPSKLPKQQPTQTQPQSNPNSTDNSTELQSSQHQPISDIGELPQQQNEVAIADTINREQQSKPARASKP